jgi:glycosyltransferase involved in cell wall biosynthesis
LSGSGGPLVSIVVPAREPREDWLREAVASALGQRGCRVEVILVDDGSPRPVASLLGGLGDPRLRLVRIDHGGVSAARNAGVAAAGGEAFRFLDADDTLEPDSTARLLALLGGRDDLVAYGATMMCDAALRPRRAVVSTLLGEVLEDALLGRFDVRIVSMLFPRRVVELAGPFDPGMSRAEDGDFVLRALEHAEVRGETAVASFYRRHGASATADVAAGEAGLRRMVAAYFERHGDRRGTALQRRAEAVVALQAARGYRASGQRARALHRLGRAALRDPRAALRAAPRLLAGG